MKKIGLRFLYQKNLGLKKISIKEVAANNLSLSDSKTGRSDFWIICSARTDCSISLYSQRRNEKNKNQLR